MITWRLKGLAMTRRKPAGAFSAVGCVRSGEPSLALTGVLVLLCHKLRKQQGHRGSRRARTLARLMRMVAIELRTWRSGRGGGSAGSVIFG